MPLSALAFLCATALIYAQAPSTKPDEKISQKSTSIEKGSDKGSFPFQIQLLQTHVRFEANGDSRKEVHTIVKLIDLMGVREFGRLTFDYTRSFQQVEIPIVRITHANGGTSDVLPSAITDAPNPAVEKFPAYQDVRLKSVRILGLQEGDTIEYRVITTTTHHPLAPDFWFEHTFDKSGQVLEEHYEFDIPTSRLVEPRINSKTPPSSRETTGTGETGRTIYRWKRTFSGSEPDSASQEVSSNGATAPDVALSTLSWEFLAIRLGDLLLPGSKSTLATSSYDESMKEMNRRPEVADAVREKALYLTRDSRTDVDRVEALYEFVSTKIKTVDIPLGILGFKSRTAIDVLDSAYATAEDKYVLFAALGTAVDLSADAALTGYCDRKAIAIPSVFKHLEIIVSIKGRRYWMEPSLEVAPFGMTSPTPAKCALLLRRDMIISNSTGHEWVETSNSLPFAAFQRVGVNATLGQDGNLKAKLKYTLRGENELLLRVAFHTTPKEKWKDVAGLLALSDGFRGVITNINASDPMATKDPFTVEYELTQEKFVDWAKKPVRIPALLPQIGLPDTSAKTSAGNIELGTPLDVETQLTLHLPTGTTAQTPAGTAVERDYATYSSKYGMTGETLSAVRHIHFLRREVAADRAADYNAFAQAVQNDQSQYFVLDRGVGVKGAAAQ
jgi:hypothetical protein